MWIRLQPTATQAVTANVNYTVAVTVTVTVTVTYTVTVRRGNNCKANKTHTEKS